MHHGVEIQSLTCGLLGDIPDPNYSTGSTHCFLCWVFFFFLVGGQSIELFICVLKLPFYFFSFSILCIIAKCQSSTVSWILNFLVGCNIRNKRMESRDSISRNEYSQSSFEAPLPHCKVPL
jgi:hypothetical protein